MSEMNVTNVDPALAWLRSNLTLFTYTSTSTSAVSVWSVIAWRLVLSISLVVIIVPFYFLHRHLVTRIFGVVAKKTKTKYDDLIVSKLRLPIYLFEVFGVVYGSQLLLSPPSDTEPSASHVFSLLTMAFLVVAILFFLLRAVDILTAVMKDKAAMTESELDDQMIPFLSKCMKVVVVIILAVVVLSELNLDTSALLSSSGLIALAFALAAKDTLRNVFGAAIIFVSHPFEVSDWVTVAGVEGVVEEVNTMVTRVRVLTDRSIALLPNHVFEKSPIVNHFRCKGMKIKLFLSFSTAEAQSRQVQLFIRAMRGWMEKFSEVQPKSVSVALVGLGNADSSDLTYSRSGMSYTVKVQCTTVRGADGYTEEEKKRREWLEELLSSREKILRKAADIAGVMGLHPSLSRRHIVAEVTSRRKKDRVRAAALIGVGEGGEEGGRGGEPQPRRRVVIRQVQNREEVQGEVGNEGESKTSTRESGSSANRRNLF